MATRSAHKNKKRNFTAEEDIVQLILHDHELLREPIQFMKDEESVWLTLRDAFEQFHPLFKLHAKPEEYTWYQRMKEMSDLDCVHGLECDVEHKLVEQLCNEMEGLKEDEKMFRAKAKVLAELVTHHLDEEEKHFLPQFKRKTNIDERIELGLQYLQLRFELEELEKGHFQKPPQPTTDYPTVSEIV